MRWAVVPPVAAVRMSGPCAPNRRSYTALEVAFGQLEEDHARLKAQLEALRPTSVFELKDKMSHAAATPPSAGGVPAPGALCVRHQSPWHFGPPSGPVETAHYQEQARVLRERIPSLGVEIDQALARCSNKTQMRSSKGDGWRAKAKIDSQKLLLMPFLYVAVGFQE